MFNDVALTGLFPSIDLARSAESVLRGVVGPRGLVRLRSPIAPPSAAPIVAGRARGPWMVASVAVSVGLLDLAATLLLGYGLTVALTALAWGVVTGAMLGSWVVTMSAPHGIRDEEARRYRHLLAGARRVLVLVTTTARCERQVSEVIRTHGGDVVRGLDPSLLDAAPLNATAPLASLH